MKVIFVVANLGGGGTERVISNLANEFIEQNIDIEIIMTAGKQIEYCLKEGVVVKTLGGETHGSLRKRIQRIFKLRRCFKEQKGSNVLSFGTETNLYSIIASIGLKVNLIISERNDPNKCSYKPLRDFLYKFAPKHVFQTEDARNCFGKQIRERGIVIPNPLNENLPAPYMGIRDKKIVAVGRLTEQKNHLLLIHAFAEFHEKFSEYKLIIYGKGEMKETLQAEINRLSLSESIVLGGFQADVLNKIIDAQMYVLSSDYEGISNSLAEAMAIGLPVISTDCPIGGSRMCIKDGYNGILVPIGDVKKLSEAMETIASDLHRADEMARHAMEIRNVLSLKSISTKWLEFILL